MNLWPVFCCCYLCVVPIVVVVVDAAESSRDAVIKFTLTGVTDLFGAKGTGEVFDDVGHRMAKGQTASDVMRDFQAIVLPRLSGKAYTTSFAALAKLEKCMRPVGGTKQLMVIFRDIVVDATADCFATCGKVLGAPKGVWDSEKYYSCAGKFFNTNMAQGMSCQLLEKLGADVYEACRKTLATLLFLDQYVGNCKSPK